MKKIVLAAMTAMAISCTASKDALNNQTFNITELNGTEYVSKGETPAFISFESGRINTSVGGNIINGSYKTGKENSLSISNGASTMMMVPDEYREDEYVSAINKVASYKLSGNTIKLIDKDGKVLIKAEK